MTDYTPLTEIEVGQELIQTFYVVDVAGRFTKTKKPYAILTVKDGSGTAEVKAWGFSVDANPDLKPKTWVKLECRVKEYRGQPDLSTDAAPMIVPQPQDISPYVNVKGLTDEEINQHWKYLVSVVEENISNIYLKTYLKFAMSTHGEGIKNGAASATNRGAYRGGLVEHYAKVMRNALHCIDVQLESKYRPEDIDREVVIASVIMHDVGKIYTYHVDQIETTTTRCGRLIQHLPLSYAISSQTWIAVESELRREAPEELKDHVNHCILAHHGKLEHGSPVKPMTIEAWIVHIADVMDSMTSNYAEDAIAREPDDEGFVPGSFFSIRPLYVGNDKQSTDSR